MKKSLIKAVVRMRFLLTTLNRATRNIHRVQQGYIKLAKAFGPEKGKRMVRVPSMLGVDEDMREWSFFMILEHNVIVNRSITAIVQSLAEGKEPAGVGAIDPKKDVMPSLPPNEPDEEQVNAFIASIDDHLKMVSQYSHLRKTLTKQHPIFGPLDAHGWHCMFGFHLQVHLKQAQTVLRIIHKTL